jgi:hypothetical protein
VRSSVRERMRVTGLYDHVGENHIFPSVDAAVQSFLSRSPKGTVSSTATEAAEPTA